MGVTGLSTPCDRARNQGLRGIEGSRRNYQPDEILAKLHQVGTLVGQGRLLHEAVREVGVSWSTYYRWRADQKQTPLVNTSEANESEHKTLRELQEENTRLRWAVADLMLEKQALEMNISRFFNNKNC